MRLEDIQPFIKEARELGVKHIYFTGGEPFVNPDILAMIDAALAIAPVTIYTNGTVPLNSQLEKLAKIQNQRSNKILLRISLDHYEPNIHEVFYNRGKGNFQIAINTATKAAQLGFNIAITTQQDIHNNATNEEIQRIFTKLFEERGVQLVEVKVLPAIPQGEQLKRIPLKINNPITPDEFAASGTNPKNLMCHIGRTIIKYDGAVRVFPCTILIPPSKETIPLFAKYEMGRTLTESLTKEQPLDHPSCRAYCVQGKQTCGNKLE